jgi:Ca2+-binding RTX toxin-like protein
MFGGGGADTFIGGAMGDLLHGAGGADTLTGGGGADTFQYRSTSDTGIGSSDHILDFTSGTDKVDLSFIDADTGTGGDQAFTYIGDGAFSGTAGELRVAFDSVAGNWRVAGDVNGDGEADFLLVIGTASADPIVAADFIL